MSKFTKNRRWTVVKDLKGFPSHKQGGVDIEFGPDGVNLTNGQSSIKANNGLVIPSSFIPGLQQMYDNHYNNQPGIPPAADMGIFNQSPGTVDYSIDPYTSSIPADYYTGLGMPSGNSLPKINERPPSDALAGRTVFQPDFQAKGPSTGDKIMGALGKIAPALSAAAPYAGAAIAAGSLAYKGLQALDRGPQSKYGMMAQNNLYNIQGYNKGGAIGDQQLSSDAIKIQGNPNQIDGNYRQVEGSEGMFNHNEVVSKLPDGTNFAFSTKYTNPLTGNSISKDAEENRKRAGKLEQKLIDNPKDAETSRLAAMLDKELTELAQLNETMKKEEQQMAQQAQSPMEFLNGGEIPRFENGGPITPELQAAIKTWAQEYFEGDRVKAGTIVAQIEQQFGVNLYNMISDRELNAAFTSGTSAAEFTERFLPIVQRNIEGVVGDAPVSSNEAKSSTPRIGIRNVYDLAGQQSTIPTVTNPENIESPSEVIPIGEPRPTRAAQSPATAAQSAPSDPALGSIVRNSQESYDPFRSALYGEMDLISQDPLPSNLPPSQEVAQQPPTQQYGVQGSTATGQQSTGTAGPNAGGGSSTGSTGGAPLDTKIDWRKKIGDVLQMVDVAGSFAGLLRGPEKEKLPRAANFQVTEVPQLNQARNAYNATARGAQTGNYNTNRYMMQGMNANYMNQLSQIGQQTQQTNLGLAAQTNQMNTQIAAQQSDINARNRGAYDQAKQAAFRTTGNVGRALNQQEMNKDAMAMMASQFDVYKHFQKDIQEFRDFMDKRNG